MAAGVQSMCEYWTNFDLQELQKELDTTATELANRQDESDLSRKRLVDQSRLFKKNTPEDIRKVVGPLLKGFQAEIDALSKRSKAAEAAFLSVYKRLIDLPDPVPVLEYALQIQKKAQRVSDLEIENQQLRETLVEYNHEFAEVKNQEVTIKQLREKLKEGEDRVEVIAETRAKEKERDLQRIFADKERQLQETQLAVAKKLGEAEQRVATLTNSLENVQSELFELKTKYDEATSAKSAEMEIVMADLERANERSTAAEREAEKLRHQLANLTASLSDGGQSQKGPDMEQAIDILQRSGLEVELAAKEKEISQLVEDVQRLQASLQKLRENTTQQVSKLEEELSSKNKAFQVLEQKLKAQEDYEEIKRELSVMKSIEFPSTSPTDEVDGGSSSDKTKPLDVLLLEKNKAIQSENTQLKVQANDISGSSSPTLSSNAEAFVSMLGEELVASYEDRHRSTASQPKSVPSSPSPSQLSPALTPSNYSTVSPKLEKSTSLDDGPLSLTSRDSQPQVPSSPHSDTMNGRHSRPPISPLGGDIRLPPPQSPQFYHPGFPGGHLLPGYMGIGVVKSEVNGMQGLDTGMVAKTVRELLSIHNIGQRLFAKHILGLSQGTVSELLSKPKSWDKLTEKGRESYRKMHSWAVDERNILALKAISPKKGSQPLLPSIQREDTATEERIAHILSEAQQAMQMKKVMEQVWYNEQQNAMVSSIYHEMARFNNSQPNSQPVTPTNSTSSHHHHSNPGSHDNRPGRKQSGDPEKRLSKREMAEGDLSAKEMVERIYRQELIKLAQAAENAGNIAASTLYQQELARLAQNVRAKDDREPGELRRARGSPDGISVKTEPPDSTSDEMLSQTNGPIDLSKHSTSSAPSTPTSAGSDKSLNNSAHHAGSAFFLVRPKMNGHDGPADNQPQSQQQAPPTPHAPQTPNTPNPQQQAPGGMFPQGSGQATSSDGVSPLQRMQNIANSLMTRPQVGTPINKPLKAVLPPITQEEFDQFSNINTEDLVKQVKETLSQYSISQRLFGESVLGLSQGSVSDLLARPKPWHMLTQKGREPFIRMQLFLEDAEAIPKLVASQYHIAPDKLMRSTSLNKEQVLPSSDKPPRIPPVPVVLPSIPAPPLGSQHPLLSQPAPPQNWATFTYPSSMLEVVAMTSEIDTLELTSRVKDVLQFNNLGQKLFGEAVLGLSQGSVSELLSKPKPWHMLSIKGREPFIKMHLWLSDPNNVERLKHCQNEIKANRRRRHSLEDRYDSPMSLPKRPRVFFSEEQKETLRQAYNRDPYPNQSTIEALANGLKVGVKTVINWFHNHRMRAKQQQHANGPATPASEFSQTNSTKMESNDDNSNNSDISSLSGENHENGGSFQPGFQSNDSSQWMFPQFEPAPGFQPKSEQTSQSSSGGSGGEEEEEEEEEAASPSSTKDYPVETKDVEKKRAESQGDENSNTETLGDRLPMETDLSSIQLQNMSHTGVNKRKRSNPQYVSAGRHLDRTVNRSDGLSQKSFSDNDEGMDMEKENDAGSSNERANKIVKLQKAIETNDEVWEDDVDRSASIEKIQKNLTQNSEEDWEF